MKYIVIFLVTVIVTMYVVSTFEEQDDPFSD